MANEGVWEGVGVPVLGVRAANGGQEVELCWALDPEVASVVEGF